MTPTDPRIIQLLEHISYALDHLGSIAEDIVDPHDYRLVQLRQSNGFIDQLLVALQAPEPLSPPSEPDKEATAPAGDAIQAAPEFASHAVGDRVEVIGPGCQQGVIIGIDPSGYATCKSEWGMLFFHDLCALKNSLKNLSQQEGGAK